MHISVYLNKESYLVLLICIRIYYIRFDINIARSNIYIFIVTYRKINKQNSEFRRIWVFFVPFILPTLASMGGRRISKWKKKEASQLSNRFSIRTITCFLECLNPSTISLFTDTCMDGSDADGELLLIQTFLLYYVNQVILMLTSTFQGQFQGQVVL